MIKEKKMNKKAGVVLSILLLLVITACSSASTPQPLEITIEMSEFAFSPQNLEFQVGQEVTLHLVNIGALGHEIMFGRGVVMKDGQPFNYETDMFEFAGVEPEVSMNEGEHGDDHGHDEGDEHEGDDMHEEDMHMEEGHTGFMVHLPVGTDEYTMKFTVTEDMVGEWEIGCFEQEGVHYTAGMLGTLVVSP